MVRRMARGEISGSVADHGRVDLRTLQKIGIMLSNEIDSVFAPVVCVTAHVLSLSPYLSFDVTLLHPLQLSSSSDYCGCCCYSPAMGTALHY